MTDIASAQIGPAARAAEPEFRDFVALLKPRVMSLVVHPYISGSPHRAKYVRQTLEYILSKPGVTVLDGEQLLDWFLGTQE